MNNLLNLDELSTNTKTIVLSGKRHEMRELTVQEFIDQSAKVRARSSDEATTPEGQLEQAMEMIADAFPTIPMETLRALKMPHMNAILEFIIQTPEQIAEAAEKANQGKP